MTDPRELDARAAALREAAVAARRRLIAQRLALAELRDRLAVMKSRAARLPKAAPAEKEAAPDSARAAATSLPAKAASPAPAASAAAEPRKARSLPRAVPYAVIAGAAFVLHLSAVRPQPAKRPAPPPSAVVEVDSMAEEAVIVAQDWRAPGDVLPLTDRLGPALKLPDGRPTWEAQRSGGSVFRVTFRPGEHAEPYAFDVDLAARAVSPTADTAQRLSVRVAAGR